MRTLLETGSTALLSAGLANALVAGLLGLLAGAAGRWGRRPCVVVAGGREPAHWEAYPDHQFIHNNGALRCCAGDISSHDSSVVKTLRATFRPRRICSAT